MKLESKEINVLYQVVMDKLLHDPDYISYPRDMKIHELLNAKLVLNDPTNRIITMPSRKFSKRYLAGEFSFYMAGSNELEFIAHYAPFWRQVSDDGITVNSCYGKRLMFDANQYGQTQLGYAISTLVNDKDSRKAIMMIYNPNDARTSKDNCCTIMLQVFIRDGFLMLTTYMRSNDIWLGTPYDIAFFTILQELIFVRLKTQHYSNLSLGSYTHLCGSLHLYEKDFTKAHSLIHSDSCVQKESSIMPYITEATFNELDTFLEFEETLRKEIGGFYTITDPFLVTMKQYLMETKK